MIRFIDLKGQIYEGTHMFAWFDTATDTFEEYCGSQAWESWEEFKKDVFFHFPGIQQIVAGYKTSHQIKRHEKLFPKDWEEKWKK